VVVNLLDNALKYTPPGGAVDVTIARESSHGLLRVRDTGVGIPREMLPRIFDLFVQGEPGAIRGRSGLGIGLAVVHHLAELHGGTIEAPSDGPGRGSTFRLRLRSAPAPRAETPRVRRPATDPPRRRIVVVEDDPDIRGMLRGLLEASGHDVAEAEDGPSAFETAVRVLPDLMLVDIGPKRIYEPATTTDGHRVLIRRLWPRGIRKERVSVWLKELGPVPELLRAYLDKALTWEQYVPRYLAGLERPEAQAALAEVRCRAAEGRVTLLCGCPDQARCHRTLLRTYLLD